MNESMGGTPLYKLTATEIARAIRARETTCKAVTRACLDRIAERDQDVQAVGVFGPRPGDRGRENEGPLNPQGALFGVPFNVKDIIDTSNMPTEYGSRYTPDSAHAPMQRVLR
jgi:Asp-tRNA(Asn)/Glu-tRNA(Gln) amidotransferase A subunit family amidase